MPDPCVGDLGANLDDGGVDAIADGLGQAGGDLAERCYQHCQNLRGRAVGSPPPIRTPLRIAVVPDISTAGLARTGRE